MKHYVMNSEYTKGARLYSSKCGSVKLKHQQVAKTIGKVTCPECLLQLMTDYETKICMLEDRYNELWPGRPVGEKIQ